MIDMLKPVFHGAGVRRQEGGAVFKGPTAVCEAWYGLVIAVLSVC